MSDFGFNKNKDYAEYAQYLATPAIPVPAERIIQCMKLILNQNMPNEEGRFEDKLPEIKYMSEDELMKYLIKTSNES
jgi:hypothetical protein